MCCEVLDKMQKLIDGNFTDNDKIALKNGCPLFKSVCESDKNINDELGFIEYKFTEEFFKNNPTSFCTFTKYLSLINLRKDITTYDICFITDHVRIRVFYRDRKSIIVREINEMQDKVLHGDKSEETIGLNDKIVKEMGEWLPK